jgi:hypothetical protein
MKCSFQLVQVSEIKNGQLNVVEAGYTAAKTAELNLGSTIGTGANYYITMSKFCQEDTENIPHKKRGADCTYS